MSNIHLYIILPTVTYISKVGSYHQVFIVKICIYFLKFQVLSRSHFLAKIQLRCALFSILKLFLSLNSKCETLYLFRKNHHIMKSTVFMDVMPCSLVVELAHTFQRNVQPPYSRRHFIEDYNTDSQRCTNLGSRSCSLRSAELINS
jgi:hypothetical protein